MDTNTAIMALITGALLPFVTGLLSKGTWPEWIKFVVVVVVAAGVGLAELALTDQLVGVTWDTLYSYLGMIYVASAAIFWFLIDSTGLRAWLEGHLVK